MTETKQKMAYNPQNGIEVEDKTLLPKDSILTGVITRIEDGKIPDFVKEEYLQNWQGKTDSAAINVSVEIQTEEEKVTITNLFTYIDDDGQTVYTPKSNLGKYVKKYGELPKEGSQVKVITNSDGFGKIKLD